MYQICLCVCLIEKLSDSVSNNRCVKALDTAINMVVIYRALNTWLTNHSPTKQSLVSYDQAEQQFEWVLGWLNHIYMFWTTKVMIIIDIGRYGHILWTAYDPLNERTSIRLVHSGIQRLSRCVKVGFTMFFMFMASALTAPVITNTIKAFCLNTDPYLLLLHVSLSCLEHACFLKLFVCVMCLLVTINGEWVPSKIWRKA